MGPPRGWLKAGLRFVLFGSDQSGSGHSIESQERMWAIDIGPSRVDTPSAADVLFWS